MTRVLLCHCIGSILHQAWWNTKQRVVQNSIVYMKVKCRLSYTQYKVILSPQNCNVRYSWACCMKAEDYAISFTAWDFKISLESECRPDFFFFTKISINEISKQWSDCCQGFYWSAHKCARCLKTVSRQSLKIFHRSSLHLEHGRTGSEGGRKRSFDFDGDSCNMEIMRTWVFRTASLCGSDWL